MQVKSEGQDKNTAALLLGKQKAWVDLLSLKEKRREEKQHGAQENILKKKNKIGR